ncbi:MAG: cytochrome-c oxidase [Ignavibacteriota bacterium]|jgi:cytochrome c oxidase subunit 4|nr:MAG: cytochrome-c oxidase [Ignavibacterium sp.]MBL1154564.1 cytochrome-c oxidase [Ignavibacteriota bacterium]MCO6447486.1 cytochrome C oxidase subunit IV family protein [Ignavibacterium album]MCZ2267269.1 cytochrome C oxidase subunit IV family protein [Ignavibacteriales bacterium]MDX9711925.1 cytochrome C oxidase subunit IV family protein [Ignavibacteriaceae bacterium]
MEKKQEKYLDNSHSYGNYILVWLALMALTAVTVAVAGINLGGLTVATALIIASVKAYLVLTIFMHLKSESKIFRVFVAVALIFLLVSFILLFSDYSFIVRN